MEIIEKLGAFLDGGPDAVKSIWMNNAVRRSLNSLNEPTKLVEEISFDEKNNLVMTRFNKEDNSTEKIVILSYNPEANSFSNFNEKSWLIRNQIIAHAIVLLILKWQGNSYTLPESFPANIEFNSVLWAYIKKYLSGKYGDVTFEKVGKNWRVKLSQKVSHTQATPEKLWEMPVTI